MKKITLFIALFLLAWSVNAQVLNNPKDGNGNMIFKWDCTNNQFATSNSFEIDENVVFAVDVTGTPLEVWLTGATGGITRSIGYQFWTQWAGSIDGRFIKIKTNIYGATMNFLQQATSRNQLAMLGTTPPATATSIGTVTQLYSNIFGFGYLGANWGAEWWQSAFFAVSMNTSAYTGTKISASFLKSYYNDTNFFPGGFTDWRGYAAPCVISTSTDIVSTVSNSPVVSYEYFTILGGKLVILPEHGIFIQKSFRQDGTSTTLKIYK
jgi:hypothetical protein